MDHKHSGKALMHSYGCDKKDTDSVRGGPGDMETRVFLLLGTESGAAALGHSVEISQKVKHRIAM